ncbi:hypothetical protein B0H16DRAFT_1468674 [Mycena metata]|uniref:Uncharacterized protein n=1 Tax=Mycena metata TaxID=1033252 RepID=A0AAD7I1M3_9AGAR|nr:hypothetical protein B0H16DRAFT_1468674 [Mycena metata]
MDASGIGRFHSTVEPLPAESMDVLSGGLSCFLQFNLGFKVFLVAISVLNDRWATRTRTSLTARDLHEARVCVRIIVDHAYYAACIRQNELCHSFSRHNTPRQASWMFYLICVLLYGVGFNGDDVPDIHGVNVDTLGARPHAKVRRMRSVRVQT